MHGTGAWACFASWAARWGHGRSGYINMLCYVHIVSFELILAQENSALQMLHNMWKRLTSACAKKGGRRGKAPGARRARKSCAQALVPQLSTRAGFTLSQLGVGTWQWGNKLLWGYDPQQARLAAMIPCDDPRFRGVSRMCRGSLR